MLVPYNEEIDPNNLPACETKKSNEVNILSIENFSSHKYNTKNIEDGKKFFKKRFIQYLKKQKQSNKPPNINIKTNQSRMSFSIDKIELKKKEEERKELKYASLFTNKTDKAIFSFNIKKYDNAYQELVSIGIIANEDEFAEFILVFPGFDKSIIGDFLAKEKSLNKGFAILKAYMKKIDFKNEYFLDSLRFLLKRMKLPSDSGLILGIIDEFTKAYYEDNKDNKNFKDSDSLYLLASTIMALNTMFTRKDIKNMNMIKKPEFISMNSDCNPDFLSKLYDDLEMNPIVIDNDYLELIYKREAVQGSLVTLLNIDKKKAALRSATTTSKLQDEILTEKQILDNLEAVKKGDVFHKYGNSDKPHKRFFQLTPDSKQLVWYDDSSFKIFRKIKKVNVIDINNVYIGINSSKVFEKFNIPLNEDQQCMSIICDNNKILALQNDNEATTKKWYYALKYLINHNKIYEKRQQALNEEDIKYFDSESDMKISQLWRNDILLNWKYYRRYLEDNYDRKELKKIKENSSSDGKVEITDENTGDDKVEIYDKHKFFEYWELGLPKFIRKKLWPIIIGNRAGITENLVEYYSKNIELLDFKQLNNLYLDYLQNKKERDEIILSEDIVMNQIINDILKITNTKYKLELFNIPPESFANSLFKIIRIFTLYRQDIIYSKEIAYISTIFLLNSENYYQALVNMVNFVLDSPGIKFIQKNEHFIKMRTSFFKNLISKYLPRLNKHFIKLEITPELYFNRWISSFFIKAFPYDVLLKLWDNYIVKGEVFLFEISLTILKIQENDCLGLAYGKILSNLRNIPFKVKYNEENFFKQLYKCDLSDEYEYIEETELGYEKAILLQSYMNDKI